MLRHQALAGRAPLPWQMANFLQPLTMLAKTRANAALACLACACKAALLQPMSKWHMVLHLIYSQAAWHGSLEGCWHTCRASV